MRLLFYQCQVMHGIILLGPINQQLILLGEARYKFMVVHYYEDIYNLVEIHGESLSS